MDFHQYNTEDFICNESFQRYCMGEDEADVSFWENWIGAHPEKEEIIAEAKRIVTILSGEQGNKAEQLLLLKDGINRFALLKHSISELPASKNKTSRLTALYMLKYAAAIAAVVVSVFVFRKAFFIAQPTYLTEQRPAPAIIESGSEPRKTVVLSDGSVVVLRENSFITLDNNFNKSNRELSLSGEAFFDVKHDTQSPFIVHTEHADIKVLGTVFNVSAYKEKGKTEAALLKGRIEVSIKDQTNQHFVLLPNQKLVINNSINKKEDQAEVQHLKVVPLTIQSGDRRATEIDWVQNRLEIENEPLEIIAEKLQHWYGIKIIFSDEEVKSYRYSGIFESETIIKALEALQLSYPFHFDVEKDKVIISK